MFWTEDTDKNVKYVVPDDVIDIAYKLDCRTLPIDHMHALATAIQQALPWFVDEEHCGVHLIHVAESGNGWMRPDDPENEVLCVSRRTRMTLRIPGTRLDDAQQLTGQTLDIDGHRLTVKEAAVKKLSALPTVFSRYVITEKDKDENEFLNEMFEQLKELDIAVKKMMAGRQHQFKLPDQTIYTRALMLADLSMDESVKLQQFGLGPGRKMGCGLFLPQKGITAVNAEGE